MNVRWHTINQSIRKSVRQKDSATASAEATGDDGASASSSVDKRSIEPPADRRLEPLKH